MSVCVWVGVLLLLLLGCACGSAFKPSCVCVSMNNEMCYWWSSFGCICILCLCERQRLRNPLAINGNSIIANALN